MPHGSFAELLVTTILPIASLLTKTILVLCFFYSIYLYKRGLYFGYKDYPKSLSWTLLICFFVVTSNMFLGVVIALDQSEESIEIVPVRPSNSEIRKSTEPEHLILQ